MGVENFHHLFGWCFLGMMLIFTELLLGIEFCVLIGFSALVTGVLSWINPTISLHLEALLWGFMSLIGLFAWLAINEPGIFFNSKDDFIKNYKNLITSLVDRLKKR